MWHFLINTAYAQATDFGVGYGSYTGLTATDPRILIANIVRIALGVLGIIAVLLVLYAGFLWMTAAGEQEKVDRAKKTLIGAVIGLVIIVSAFAIASFVLNSLSQATGINSGNVNNGGGPGGGLGGGSGTGFRPTGIQPSGTLSKRDVVASVTFSSAPTGDTANIKSNIKLEMIVGGVRTIVDYDSTVSHNTIRLVPKTACPDPNPTRFCLDANADFQVTVSSGLKSADGTSTANCGIGTSCTQSFHTGDVVNTAPPGARITSPADGQSIPVGALIQVQSLLTDSDGISNIDYAADGAFFGSDGNASNFGGGNFSSQVSWDTTGIAALKTVALTANATNIDGDSGASAPVSVVIRPTHCFNRTKDADETAVDCGGAECGACSGGTCTSNAQCAAGECVAGQCVETPKISDVQLRDGKPGNLVTVSGERFGTTPGQVVFLGEAGDADDMQADITLCQNGWHDTTIVVAVPVGAKSGPIKLVSAAGKTDATNDANGPIITDFVVNDVARPGICSVNPTSAAPKDAITLGGTGFGATQAGSRITFTEASDTCAAVGGPSYDAGAVASWTDLSAQPKVPNITTGSDGVKALVTVTASGQTSNPVCIQVLAPDAGTLPHVDFLSPTNGPVGTYLTLTGSNFGSDGKVKFAKSGQTAYGDTSFPQQCSAKNWNSTNVVVKVPSVFTVPAGTALAQGDYGVDIVRADGTESNVLTFTVNTSPLAPGICLISPDNGPVGTGVSLYGERLGNVASSDLTALLSAHPDAIQFSTAKNVTAIASWNDNAVTTAAPAGATTGPVVLHTYNGGATQTSNGVNFRLADCRSAAAGTDACGAGLSCCPDGACRLSGECNAAANSGGFAWTFSTGPISLYPTVLENATCEPKGNPSVMPSPNPFRGTTGVCTDIGKVAMVFSLPMDPATVIASNIKFETCGADSAISICTPGQLSDISLTNNDKGINNLLAFSVNALAANTWYKVTLKSSTTSGFRSLATVDRTAQSLDGDNDGKGGGDYITTFRTGASACAISGVNVQPSNGLITSSSEKLRFQAFPLSDSCIILQCGSRNVAWSSSDIGKATVSPAGGVGACVTDASPVSETVPGPAIQIKTTLDAISVSADLTVDYANPQVLDYGPHDCTVACPNTLPFAHFNTAMKTIGTGNLLTAVKLQRCRNESCLAFDGDVAISPTFDPGTIDLPVNLLKLQYSGLLAANTFYRVTIDGTARSTSDAPLSGLNYGGSAFSWIFRTRTDGNPCGPQSITVTPPVTTLRYIGEVEAIKADPLTSPDSCSAAGQLLTAASFNWSWVASQNPSSPEAFTIRPYDPNPNPSTLDTNVLLPATCTAQCLNAGSAPTGTAVCGDGKVGKGEACDTPEQNGCSARCLRTGNASSGAAGGQCGNGVTDANAGESCDAGANNGKAGSGCDTNCLLTGSTAGASQCGNGSVGLGEECDDANTISGDGCTSSCLLEGSDQNVAACGNGVLEVGESCDYITSGGQATGLLVQGRSMPLGASDNHDPQSPSFPCTNRCLLRGNTSVGTGAVLCGNGVIDSTKGESCDAGLNNGKSGYGCSNTCLKTGAEAQLRAFCGDTRITGKAPDVSGAQNGGGEECDAGATDSKIDPVQYVTAKAQCDGNNNCTGSVSAAIDTIKGSGSVSVECSCTTDSDCTIFDGTLACGAGACCYKKPALPAIKPAGGNQCRNVLVTIDFPQTMNQGTLTGGVVVYEQKAGCTAPAFLAQASGGNFIAKATSAARSLVGKLFGKEASAAACTSVKGIFTHTTVTRADGTSYTHSSFAPEQAYGANASYVVAIKGGSSGVKTVTGVGYGGPIAAQQAFSTGANVCKFDVVQVSPASELISSSSQVYTFQAKFMTQANGNLTELAPIPGVYAWTSTWSTVQTPTGILTTANPTAGSVNVQAQAGKNGTAQIISISTITANTVIPDQDPVGTKKSGKADVTILLCEHPWPSRAADGTWSPYVDPETHFKMFYCLDKGDGTLLPDLNATPTQAKVSFSAGIARFCATTKAPGEPNQHLACTSDSQCGGAGSCLPKDQLFRFADPHMRDAFGFRVFTNVERLSPQDWYAAQKFTEALSPTTVDGYEAVKDTRTAYVVAADKYGDPTLVPYTYVLGYNDNATADTIAIYNQLLTNLTFNANMSTPNVTNVCKLQGNANPISTATGDVFACSTDLDCFKLVPNPQAGTFCDAPKDKLRRDMKRWQDLRGISNALQSSSCVGDVCNYPKIDSGSFIKGMTTSKWPSWTSLLGAAGAVVDPVNDFLACDKYGSACAVTGKPCASTAECDPTKADDTCQPKFDAETCFSQKTDLFLCPAGSNIYRYTAIGGNDYQLNAEFEYTAVPWSKSCVGLSGFECGLRPDCRANGANCEDRVSIAPSCAGLFNATPLKCNGNGNVCGRDTDCPSGQLCLPNGSAVFGNAVNQRCGNSVVEAGEQCESGMTATASCPTSGSQTQSCDSSCHWTTSQACPGASVCGNGAVEYTIQAGGARTGETCDDGSQNGGYGKCRSGSFGCMKRCVNTTQRDSFNCTSSSCPDIGILCTTNADCGVGTNTVCTDRMQFCGDGVKNGSESCDDGPSNGNYGQCAWDCSGPGPRCGDNNVNGPEQCDGSIDSKPGVCMPNGLKPADASPITESPNAGFTGCAKDADCGAGTSCVLCGPTQPDNLPQTRAHSCNVAGDANACTFAGWSACKPSGSCGNGVVEGSEACDQGSANSPTGSCLPSCRKNVCGDGFAQNGVEQCDSGASNGVACTAPYGTTCSFCKTNCTVETTSGLYCGDSSARIVVNSPPEMCDPGHVSKWCSKTYLSLLHPYKLDPDVNDPYPKSDPPTRAEGPKTCVASGDCTPGICKAFPFTPLGDRNATCPVQGQAGQTCVPDASNACGSGGGANCCDVSKCKCPPGYEYSTSEFKCKFKPSQVKQGFDNKSCNSSADCDTNTQYCSGGEGECIAYGSQCTPDAYSNTFASAGDKSKGILPAPNYHDGNCVGCSNSCSVVSGKSPYYCGDAVVELNYGEQCEETGDPGATGQTGTKSFYGCGKDCLYNASSGYCGDNRIDVIPAMGVNETCDGTSLGSVAGKTCASYGWGDAGAVSCGSSCKPYGGGCSDGDLSPGDVRVKIIWMSSTAGDLDTHFALPSGASAPNVGYGTVTGSVSKDPHVWWSWDDTSASKGRDVAPLTGVHGLEIMTVNWRGDGRFWPSTVSNPYKLFVYNYSQSNKFTGAYAVVCTYRLGLPKNADCSRVYTAPSTAGNYWYVTGFWGTDQTVPTFVEPAGRSGVVGNCADFHMSTGGCPAIGI